MARGRGQDVELRERPDLADASSSESDRYEELLVNPTLITLARQRGEIDCGGRALGRPGRARGCHTPDDSVL